MPSILFSKRNQLASRAALRNLNSALGQRLLDEFPIREIERQEDLSCLLLHADVAPGEKHRHHVGVILAVDVREEALLPRQEFAAADSQYSDAGVIAIPGVPDDVAIATLYL